MKISSNILIIIAILTIASCSRGFFATSSEYDDVYYMPGKKVQNLQETTQATQIQAPATEGTYGKVASIPYPSNTEGLSDYERYRLQKEQEESGESQAVYRQHEDYYDDSPLVYEDGSYQGNSKKSYSYYDQDSDRVVINNYYGSDFYDYDYLYSSRIRRFSRPYYSWNYYDPFFTDMFYYNYNPAYWGMSIYYGSYFSPYFGFSYSPWYYGGYYPYYSWRYYDPWYSSFYSPFYRSYYMGYYDYYGFGYYPYSYYYPYYSYSRIDRNRSDYYYGHRSSRSGFSPYSSSASSAGDKKSTLATDPRVRSVQGSSATTEGVKRSSYPGSESDPAIRTRTLSGASTDIRRETSSGSGVQKSGSSIDNSNRTRPQSTNISQENRALAPSGTSAVRQPSASDIYKRPVTQPGVTGSNERRQVNTPQQSGTYTPTYTKPRTTSTPTYNRSDSPGSTKSGTITNPPSGSTSGSSPAYTRPSTSTSPQRTVSPGTRTQSNYRSPSGSSSTYSRPAPAPSSNAVRPAPAPSRSYSSPSTSSPSRYSSGSPSYSGSSSSGSRSSSGSSSSSSSGHSNRSSSGSGRR